MNADRAHRGEQVDPEWMETMDKAAPGARASSAFLSWW